MIRTDNSSPFPILHRLDSRRVVLSPEYQQLVRTGQRLPPPHVCNVFCEREKRRKYEKERGNG